ncbi:MAG: TRCF domain-containing protein, partial [Bacilli bacterium]
TSVKDNDVKTINLKNIGYIPQDYQLDDNDKIKLYQNIYDIKNVAEFEPLQTKLEDLYGKLPLEIKDIINKRKFEILVHNLKRIKVIEESNKLQIQLDTNINNKKQVKEIFSIIDDFGAIVSIEIKYQKIHLSFYKIKNYLSSVNDVLLSLKGVLSDEQNI